MSMLFNKTIEEEQFNNALANRRIRQLQAQVDYFNREIDKAIDECGVVFEQYNVPLNYVKEIEETEREIIAKDEEDSKLLTQIKESKPRYGDLSLSTSNYKSTQTSKESLVAKRDSLSNEATEVINKLPLNAREELEFSSKKIPDRKARRDATIAQINELKKLFPKAVNFDISKAFEGYPLKDIKEYITPEVVVEEEQIVVPVKEEVIPEVYEPEYKGPKVVRIRKAPDKLLQSLTENKEEEKEQGVNEIESDNSFYDEEDTLAQSIAASSEEVIAPNSSEDVTLEDNIEFAKPLDPQIDDVVLEPVTSEVSDVVVEPVSEEKVVLEPVVTEKVILEPTPEVTTDEVITNEEPEVTTEKEKEEPAIEATDDGASYVMPEGQSLTTLAEVVYLDKGYWYGIYEKNKELLDNVIKNNNLNDIEEAINNGKIFAGIELIVPLEPKMKEANETKNVSLVA